MSVIVLVDPINDVGINPHLTFIPIIGAIPRVTGRGKDPFPPAVEYAEGMGDRVLKYRIP